MGMHTDINDHGYCNAKGHVGFYRNTFDNPETTNMATVTDGGAVEWDAQHFESFAVCPADNKNLRTLQQNDGRPYLQFWTRKQKNKLSKKCALVELVLVG